MKKERNHLSDPNYDRNSSTMHRSGIVDALFKSYGFSLLELMIVMVLASGLMLMVGPALSSLTGMDQKKEITKIAGLMNEVYARAALSGQTHRIVFDFASQSYSVEVKDESSSVPGPSLGYEELMKEYQERKKGDKDLEGEKRFLPQFKAAEGELGEKIKIASGFALFGAWTESMKEVAREGQVSIYFFPGGYTQASFVSIIKANDPDSAMYVALNPLTGAVEINYGEPQTTELLDSGSEK
jgi:general secretion pathway protein H